MRLLMKALTVALMLVALPAGMAGSLHADEAKKASKEEEKRAKIDQNTKEALDRLFKESAPAKTLYDKAYGYAVFSDTKVSFGLTGGGGSGKAVNRKTGKATYMKMATAGVALGLGAQHLSVVFLFEDEKTFTSFVDKGWQAEGGANAVAGKAGANAEASFKQGMAVYQLTEKGLMLQADISGTKYSKSDDLN